MTISLKQYLTWVYLDNFLCRTFFREGGTIYYEAGTYYCELKKKIVPIFKKIVLKIFSSKYGEV